MSLDAPLMPLQSLPGEGEPTPASADRFGRRWRLVAAGLSNVWRFGDLLMDANSGRLLMRGPNGTGKTTALEVLWPYLLDLNSRLLGAGKARQTTWTSLMREGANGVRRRVGYAWLTFAGPGEAGELSYGVRLQFSEGSSPPVKIDPIQGAWPTGHRRAARWRRAQRAIPRRFHRHHLRRRRAGIRRRRRVRCRPGSAACYAQAPPRQGCWPGESARSATRTCSAT